MNSSSKRKQGSRRITPAAESLEGRQLLSTLTTTTSAAPVAVSAPSEGHRGFAGLRTAGTGGFAGRGFFARYDMGAMTSSVAVGSGSGAAATTSPTTIATSTDPTSTTSSTTVAAPTTLAPASAILPWAGGMFGLRDGFGGSDGFSNFGGATASSGLVGGMQSYGAIAASTGSTGYGGGVMSPFVGQLGGATGGLAAPSILVNGSTAATSTGSTVTGTTPTPTPTLSPYAQAEKTAFQQLQTDEQAIHDKSQVTPALQAAFRNDLTALAKEITQAPSATTVLALQSDLATVAGTLPTSDQLTTIQTDFTAVLTSAGVTDATGVTKTFSDLSALLTATNIGSGDVSTLTADLKAAGLPTNNPLMGVDLGVNLDSLVSTVMVAGFKATAATSTTTTATPTSTAPASTSTTTATT